MSTSGEMNGVTTLLSKMLDNQAKQHSQTIVQLQELNKTSNRQLKMLECIIRMADRHLLRTRYSPVASDKQSQLQHQEFTKKVLVYYGMMKRSDDTLPKTVYCHVLGRYIPRRAAVVAHIFPMRYRDVQGVIDYGKINKPSNTLVLSLPIEKAFDRNRICFAYDHHSKHIRLRVLDPDLNHVKLIEEAVRYHNDLSALKDPAFELTFHDLDNKPLSFLNRSRPDKKCMLFMEHINLFYAFDRNYLKKPILPELDDACLTDGSFNKEFMPIINKLRDAITNNDDALGSITSDDVSHSIE